MPLFIDLRDTTPDPAVWYRVSDEYIAADDPHNDVGVEYLPLLIDLGEVRIAQQYIHGGLVTPEYGGLEVSPELFAGSWPPPRRLDCWVSYVRPGSAPAAVYGADRVVMASAILAEWSGSAVRYDLVPASYTDEVEDITIFGPLDDVCANHAASLTMPETISGSGTLAYAGRAAAPPVSYRVRGKRFLLPLLGEIAAFFTHRIVVNPLGGATMTDATQAVGTALDLRPRDVVSISYLRGDLYRRYEASYVQPYIRNIELRISQAGGSTLVVLSEVDIAKTVGGALTAPAVAALARHPSYTSYDPSLSGYPVSNAVDGSQSTIWATTSGWFAPDDPAQICLSMAVASGAIAEYALTSRTSTPYAAPSRWDLYGWDENRSKYQYISSVESSGWGSLEHRKYTVPTETDWPVQLDGDGGSMDIWTAPLVGNEEDYGAILLALGYIKTLTETERARVVIPMGLAVPHIGQQINLWDDTTPELTTGYMVVSSLTYNFVEQIIVAEGGAVITGR